MKPAVKMVLIAALVCSPLATTGAAEIGADQRYATGRVYAELGVGAGGVRVGELDFYPGFATVTLGAWPLPGIGVEVFADAGLREGRDDGFELEIDNAYGAALRFESPPLDGLAGFVVLGYAAFELRQSLRDDPGGNTVEEEFGGGRVSIGLVQRFRRLPGLSVSAEYRKYNVEDGLDLDALVVGLRVSAP